MTIELSPSEPPKLGARNLDSDNIWIDLTNSSRRLDQATPALFLDRDGVIVVDAHYLGNPDDAELLPGAADLIKAANTSHIPVVVVTNQSGIGRGHFGWSELDAVQDRIRDLLAEHDARWDAVLACPYHHDASPPFQHADHPYRKPNPGMIIAAEKILNIDLARSWIVGDNASDLAAGRNAGLMGGVHVATNPTSAAQERAKAEILKTEQFRVLTRANMTSIWDILTY